MPAARKVNAAVAQISQEFFDTTANLKKAVEAIHEAGRNGADIIVFSECFLGQYPYWAQYHNAPQAGFRKTWTALFEGAVQVGGEECATIGRAAKEANIYVVMGCNELSDEKGSETIYNSMLFFDRHGHYMGRHRKLMPTYHERMVHGQGDGRDLRVYDTDIGMLGGLICWEHHMTLSKYAMASMGEEIHVANWPGNWRPGIPAEGERVMEPEVKRPYTCDVQHGILEYATETGNFVLSASGYMDPDTISDEWKEAIPSLQADWAVGGSAIVAPGGKYLVEPVINQEKILYAELDFNERRLWKSWFDPIGHYSRRDVYNLQLNQPNGREFSYINDRNNDAIGDSIQYLTNKYGLSFDEIESLIKSTHKMI